MHLANAPIKPCGKYVRKDSYQGINYQCEHTPASISFRGTPQGEFVIFVKAEDGPHFDIVRTNEVESRDMDSNYITRTGFPEFDRGFYISTDTLQLADDFFHKQSVRDHVARIMALGFSSIGRNGDGAWAKAGPFFHIPIRVECSLLFNGLTSLAGLAGIQPEPGAKSEFSLNQQIERISWLITPKRVGVATIPLLLPILAPFAYLYIGGLWHGLLSAIPILGALLIIDSLHYDLQASTAAAIAPFVAWKAYMATETRNNLIAADMATPKEFSSFHYAINSMSDLFIGCCMGLVSGICLTLILSRHSIFGDYWIITFFISAILIIWISELLCEVTLVRMYEKFVGKQNPFFLQYHSRWDRSNQQSTPGEVARFNISQLLPSKKEALTFLLLSVIVSVNMLFSGL